MSNSKTKATTTFALFFGNRGFFPASLQAEARKLLSENLKRLGYKVLLLDEDATVLFDEGETLASRSGAIEILSLFNAGYGLYNGVCLGKPELYWRHAVEGARLADTTDNEELQYASRIFHQYGALFSGRLEESVEVASRMIRLKPDDPAYGMQLVPQSPLITYHIGIGFASRPLGDLGAIERSCAEIERLFGKSDWREGMSHHKWLESCAAGWRGDIAGQLRIALRGVELAEEHASLYSRVGGYELLGQAYLASGDTEQAIEYLTTANGLNEERSVLRIWTGGVQYLWSAT